MKAKNTAVAILFVGMLLVITVQAEAQIFPKETRVIIHGNQTLSSYLAFQEEYLLSGNFADTNNSGFDINNSETVNNSGNFSGNSSDGLYGSENNEKNQQNNGNNRVQRLISKVGEVCYIELPMHLSEDSVFHFDGNDCRELRMYPGTYIRIAGEAYFNNIKVTSADPLTKNPIVIDRESYYKERPHIYTKFPVRFVGVNNSEFSYLGYYDGSPGSSWGVSFWGLAEGVVENSKFHNNYFGFYTFETNNLRISNNEVYDNVEYGLDFHDYSDNFVVENNEVYRNGNHGLIFSKFCENNTIRNNYVHDHTEYAFVKGEVQSYKTHGIMLHKDSNNNSVQNNILENNDYGIILYRSHDNTIKNNIILNDTGSGMYFDNSSDNHIRNNIVLAADEYGLYSYYSDRNTFTNNYIANGTYFKEKSGEEILRVKENKLGVIQSENSPLTQSLLKSEGAIIKQDNYADSIADDAGIAAANIGNEGSSGEIENERIDFLRLKIYALSGIAAILLVIVLVDIAFSIFRSKEVEEI